MASQFIVPSFLLLPIMASPLPAGLHSLPMYSTPARHRLNGGSRGGRHTPSSRSPHKHISLSSCQ
ncbi:hypothetical protein C8R44DRAFT_799688 [Mycena epipterygia]|nr:hypothetical protein C8R44DRAFT_799688 [Mycena epipterygia]